MFNLPASRPGLGAKRKFVEVPNAGKYIEQDVSVELTAGRSLETLSGRRDLG